MSSHENKLDYVDAMRGIAILMVILVHTSQRIPLPSLLMDSLARYGQMGVQLFFVASAYTLCISFERRSEEPYRISSFYIRRWFRIAPLYYLAILIYFVVHIATQLYMGGRILAVDPYSISNAAANIMFIHGFVSSANNNVVPGGWSIGTEMAFYLIFPLLFLISKKIAEKRLIHLFALFMVCLGANLALQLTITEITQHSIKNNDFRYFNILNQLPVFILGIIAYFLHSKRNTHLVHSIISSRVISALGFLFFSTTALLLLKANAQLLPAIIPTISAVSFLFLLNWLKAAKRQSQILCQIGTVSYSMYVFHFLFAWILIPIIFREFHHMLNPDIELLLAFSLASTLTFLVALFTQQAIEAKGISAGARLISLLQARASPLLQRADSGDR